MHTIPFRRITRICEVLQDFAAFVREISHRGSKGRINDSVEKRETDQRKLTAWHKTIMNLRATYNSIDPTLGLAR
jgi:hypothetical protein